MGLEGSALPSEELLVPEALLQPADFMHVGEYGLNRLRAGGMLDGAIQGLDQETQALIPRKSFAVDLLTHPQLPEILTLLVDGWNTQLAKRMQTELPLLWQMSKKTPDAFTTQDYPKAEAGLPGFDWSLWEKAGIRVGEMLRTMDSGEQYTYVQGLSQEAWGEVCHTWKRMGTLQPWLRGVMLHLDVAKGGDKNTRSQWEGEGVDLAAHNRGGAKLVEKAGVLRSIAATVVKSEEHQVLLERLGVKLIEYHGLVGQWVRGEVSEDAFAGLIDFAREHREDLGELFEQVGVGEVSVGEMVAQLFRLANIVDTATVKPGLYDEVLNLEFGRLTNTLAQGIDQLDYSMDRMFTDRVEELRGSGEVDQNTAEIMYVTDRLWRLRGYQDKEEILGLLLEMRAEGMDEVIGEIFEGLRETQLWYAEKATVGLRPEEQLKILYAGLCAGSEVQGQRHINFAPLMNVLRNKNTGEADFTRNRLLEVQLSEKTFAEMKNMGSGGLSVGKLKTQLKLNESETYGRQTITVNLEMDDLTRYITNAIEQFARSEDMNPFERNQYENALQQLVALSGMKLDEWDRVFDQRLYEETMNQTMKTKAQECLESMGEVVADINRGSIVTMGIGSGTGELEKAMAEQLRQDDVVLMTDASVPMVRLGKRLERIMRAKRFMGGQAADLRAMQLDATAIDLEKLGVDKVDVVTMFSLIHELPVHLRDEIMSQVLGLSPELVIIRDFGLPIDPTERVTLAFGDATANEMPIGQYLEFFRDNFPFAEDRMRAELKGVMERFENGERQIELSMGLAFELMGKYSWLKDGENSKEITERYGHFTEEGVKAWIGGLAQKLGREVTIDVKLVPAGYEKYIGHAMSLVSEDGEKLPAPICMMMVQVKKVM